MPRTRRLVSQLALALVGAGCTGTNALDVDGAPPTSNDATADRPGRAETGPVSDASTDRTTTTHPDGSEVDARRRDAFTALDASDDRTSTGDGGLPDRQPPPQVIDFGGSTLTSPSVQLIAYAADPTVDAAVGFINDLGATAWAIQTGEYSVGPFTQLPTILIPGAPPGTLDDVGAASPFETTLATNTSGAEPSWGAANASTEYLFLLPAGTTITTSLGACCSTFVGYHSEATVGATSVPYAVVCDCGGEDDGGLTAMEQVTTTIERELVEAATDPLPSSSPGYRETDLDDILWTAVTGGEVADMCARNADTAFRPDGSAYTFVRSWSNAAARAGTDPCVPAPSTPYFNSYAIYGDPVTLYGGAIVTKGVKIDVGATRTVDVVLWSPSGTADPWTVAALDYDAFLGNSPGTTLSLDETSGVSGDVLHLTITVNTYDAITNGAGVVLSSTLGGHENLTMFAVGN